MISRGYTSVLQVLDEVRGVAKCPIFRSFFALAAHGMIIPDPRIAITSMVLAF